MGRSTDHIIMITDPESYAKDHPHITVRKWCTMKVGGFFCEKCGETFNYDMPCRLDMANGVAKLFMRLHKNCGKEEDE